MEISTDFALPLAPDPAYQLLLDLERVAPCMPGASLGDERDDGSREVSVAVRLGPMKFNYGGTVHISERDAAARRAVMVGSAQEKRGQGSARATITMTVSEADDGTSRVNSLAEFDLTGRAAQTGRGIVEDVARRMVSEMATCLSAQASSSAPAEQQSTEGIAASAAADTASTAPPGGSAGAPSPASASPPPAREIRAGSLMWSVFKDRLARLGRRILGRPPR